MDKCEIHPHCFKQGETPCPACVSQAALDKVRVAPRKMTMGEERLTRLLSIRGDKLLEMEEELYSANLWRKIYSWAAIGGWLCLIIYSAFGGPEV
ncbi:hypothetical protein D3C76_407040 [compost metagenome]